MSRNLTTSLPISASFLAKRKWPTSVSPRSISSIGKTLAAACNWPGFVAAVVAVPAVPAVAAVPAVSGVAAAAAQAGERAAFAKLHDLANERQDLTNCRAGISTRRIGDDLGMGEEIGHFLPTADAERADAPALNRRARFAPETRQQDPAGQH
jgi:hypothetical protein